MILKALCDYYHRCEDLPRKGLAFKEIGFLIVIDKEGNFKKFEDRRIDSQHAHSFLVMKSVGRSSAPVANYLYDNCAYVLGYSDKNSAEKYYNTFKKKITDIYNSVQTNCDINAVFKFYQQDIKTIHSKIQQDPLWADIKRNLNKKYSVFSFLIEGDTKIIAEKKELHNLLNINNTNNRLEKVCLVSGNKGEIVETTTATMVPGSQATAKLVSFQVKSGYDSYGKEKGHNAPISEFAEFAYTTALNHLLRTNSRNKFFIGNRTFIFWASNNNEAGRMVEDGIFSMFGFQENNDDPNKKIEQVRKVFEAIYKGNLKTSLDDRFYILGLAPNSARIAVTYWAEILLKDFAELINRHFLDMEIVDGRKEQKPYSGLRSILSAVTLDGKVSEVTPNLPEAVVKSIFQGLSYPQPLFASCMRRIRAGLDNKKWDDAYKKGWVTTRAAIIKAYLNRLKNKEQKIDIMLDKENRNQGYLCGRLFAVLERIQEISNRENDYFTNLRSNYMNSASTAPSTVLPTILNLSVHHSDKLDRKDMILFEREKQEIINKLKGFPNHLSMDDQGRFFIGYYHQRQDFFIKSEENNNEE